MSNENEVEPSEGERCDNGCDNGWFFDPPRERRCHVCHGAGRTLATNRCDWCGQDPMPHDGSCCGDET